MKTKLFLSMLGILAFTFASIAQRGEVHQKKKCDPETKANKKVERFAAQQEISETQKIALNEALVTYYNKKMELDKKEKENKLQLKAEKNKKIKEALEKEELQDSWEMFEKRERMRRKMKKHNKQHPNKKNMKQKKQLKKSPQYKEK